MSNATRLTAATVLSLGLLAAQTNQRTFASPKEAAQATMEAAEHNDTAALLKLFGANGKDIVESGDPAQDKANREEFAKRAHASIQIIQDPTDPDHASIIVGEEKWPFPVPLVRKDGQWRFDAVKGRMEILAHRIGENELTAGEVCRGYVEAQLMYAQHDRNTKGVLEYAQKIGSTPGKQDGLYWEGESDTLVPKAFADAAAAGVTGAGKQAPYHGYYFRILKAQGPDAEGGALDYVVNKQMIGGFAMIAWPAEYGVSGVHTFIVSHRGVVYEKDLGPATPAAARQTVRFNPDKSWKKVDE